MRRLLRAELVKMATTRTAVGLVVGGAAVAALGAFSTIMSGQPADLAKPLHEQMFFLLASINLSLFAVVLGIRGFTDEYRHALIVPTLLVTPSRVEVVAAKTVVLAAAGAVLATLAQVVMLAVTIPLLQAQRWARHPAICPGRPGMAWQQRPRPEPYWRRQPAPWSSAPMRSWPRRSPPLG